MVCLCIYVIAAPDDRDNEEGKEAVGEGVHKQSDLCDNEFCPRPCEIGPVMKNDARAPLCVCMYG